MSDTTTETAAVETSDDSITTAETATVESTTEVRDPAKLLSAYEAEKTKRREQDVALRDLTAKFDAMQAKAEGKEAEFLAAQESQKVKDEAISRANDKILKSEVKAAAKGVLADPQDAYKFLDLGVFEVDDDGNVDEPAVAKALADLVAAKPYLGAQGAQRFTGDADGGARKVTPPASIEEQITELQKAGNHKAAAALKANQLLELRNPSNP